MIEVLYIDCCVRREVSRTRILADAFLEALKDQGRYSIKQLCLMDEPIVPLSEGFFQQREILLSKASFDHPRFRYAHQFQQAQKIIIATPFWDLGFPSLLKIYIENVSLDGVTFACDQAGCHGTCLADHLLFLTTRGGDYSNSPLEMGARYLEALCEFFGVPRFDCIAADGMDLGLESPLEILNRAIEKAKKLAANF